MATVAPTQTDILTALRAFLVSILPPGVVVQQGQANRVAEPSAPDFVLMTPMLRRRLGTNVDTYGDVAFKGSISGTVLTVSAMQLGEIAVGNTLFGAGVAPGTTILAFGSGTGGVGTYTLSQAQSLASQQLAAGLETITQATQVTVQLDVHGPNGADNAQTISTLFRDGFACDALATSGVDVTPLYADDPRQMPFVNGESQFEFRWTVDVTMQVNAAALVPMQFADALVATPVSVHAAYPAD